MMTQYRGQPVVHLFAADAASVNGDRAAAIQCLEALPGGQNDVAVVLRKAELLFSDSQRSAALETARAAAQLVPSEEWQLRTVGRLFRDCQDLEGAREWLLKAHETLPGSSRILYDLALSEFHLNLPDEAEAHIELLLLKDALHSGALHLRSALRTQTPEHNHVENLRERLQSPSQPANVVTAVNFALAKEYEDLEQYEESFAALGEGAGAYRQTLKYNPEAELASHAGIRKQFTRRAFEALGHGFENENPNSY